MPTFRLLLGTVMQIILLQEKNNLYVVEISSSMWMWGSSMEILLWRSLQRALKKPFCLRCSREPETGQSFSEAYICAISTGIWFIWNVSIWCSRNKECISNYFIASMCQCTFKNRIQAMWHYYFHSFSSMLISGQQQFFWLNTLFQSTLCLCGSLV